VNSPLAGKRIVNTRAAHQAAALDRLLREHGAEPLAYPCIAIAPPDDTTQLDNALRAVSQGAYNWLILTSANTVLALAQRLAALGLSLTNVSRLKTAAVGPATAQAAGELLGLHIEIMPDEYVAEALADALALSKGARVLLPQSGLARPALAETLSSQGASVTVIEAYQTVVGSGGTDVPRLLAQQQVDAISFTSPSTVNNFLRRLENEGGNRNHLSPVCIACIGPQTTQAARNCGLHVSVVPEEHTVEGLVESLQRYFEKIGAR
jgi:uroporphyrinogen-III synthase